jgi:hypothetical protein
VTVTVFSSSILREICHAETLTECVYAADIAPIASDFYRRRQMNICLKIQQISLIQWVSLASE